MCNSVEIILFLFDKVTKIVHDDGSDQIIIDIMLILFYYEKK